VNQPAVSQSLPVEPLDDEVGVGSLPFGRLLRTSDLVVGAAAVAGAGVSAAIVLTGGVATDPIALAAVLFANVAALSLSGQLWRRARPSSSFGMLLLVEGLLVVVSSLAGSSASGLYLIGVLGGWAAALGVTWLLVVFPRTRPEGAGWIVIGSAFAAFVLGELPTLLTSHVVHGLAIVGRCTAACPANPTLVADAPTVARAFGHVEAVLQCVWGIGLLIYIAQQLARASQPRRRLVAPVFIASAPWAVVFTANALVSELAGVPTGAGTRALYAAARILLPFGFIASLLCARAYAGEALTFMATRLVGQPPVAAVEQLVRRVLDDPQSLLVFWLPRRRKFVDRHGNTVLLDPAEEGLTWRSFGPWEEPVLAICYESVLSDDAELVEAAGAAAMLTLENRRLHQDLVDSVQALRASQQRLVAAASMERRRIERDLHDGVQQRIAAVRIHLELTRDLAPKESRVSTQLAVLASELDETLDELRAVVHGVYPPRLAEAGLAEALREAQLHSTVPVVVELEDVGRLSEACEIAVYYCCLEALQNVAKHAGESAGASLRLWRDWQAVRFSVSDDGAGFVPGRRVRNGGLTNMGDRIGAVGGSMAVRSEPGAGTTVEGRVPFDAASPATWDVLGA
jgi:signal transduction histidine kinase